MIELTAVAGKAAEETGAKSESVLDTTSTTIPDPVNELALQSLPAMEEERSAECQNRLAEPDWPEQIQDSSTETTSNKPVESACLDKDQIDRASQETELVQAPERKSLDAVLSMDQILSVDTLPDLRALYAAQGHSFLDNQSFLKQIKHDYRIEQERIRQERLQQPLPESVEALIVQSEDGRTYHIYGVEHDKKACRLYLNALENTLKQETNWFGEQNFKSQFFPAVGIGTDMQDLADHLAEDKYSLFELFCAGLTARVNFVHDFIPNLPGGRIFPGTDYSSRHKSNPIKAEREMQRYELSREEHSAHCLLLPADSHRDLPAYVKIESTLEAGEALSSVPRRSAYMAEVLRRLDCGTELHFMTGFFHAAEIQYFLAHPTNDPEIVALAAEHAKILNEDPQRWETVTQEIKNCESRYWARNLGVWVSDVAIATGAIGTVAGTAALIW